MKLNAALLAAVLSLASLASAFAQGTFQNLDFENGTFIPIPGDPFGRVQFSPAMPGWTGFVGTNQIDWILHNNLFLSTAGIAIWGARPTRARTIPWTVLPGFTGFISHAD